MKPSTETGGDETEVLVGPKMSMGHPESDTLQAPGKTSLKEVCKPREGGLSRKTYTKEEST